MWASKQACSLVVSNILLPIALVLFLSGLLRPKASITEYREEPDIIRNVDTHDVPSAPVDRVVFMLVDALRSDFVFSNDSGFTYTQSLIRSGAALPFTGLAGPPTLTMPRVKAMTTGSSPCFLDMLLNIRDSENRTEAAHTWLDTLKAADQDKKLVFYGSKTWTDLYPGAFDRFQGMDGNYVPDFTLVDEDVVREIPKELENDDWSALVLHLSGLDHVGHIGGPKSPYMHSKQQEMDGLVQQIFEAMETKSHLKRTLLVLAGDHGMDSRGNHGGSLESEMSAALVMLSPEFQPLFPGTSSPTTPSSGGYGYHTVIDQSDIVPTLTSLLGIEIPRLSLGVLIPNFLPLWPDIADHVHQLRRNAAQLMKAYIAHDASFDETKTFGAEEDCLSLPGPSDQLLCLWGGIEKGIKSTSDEALPALYAFCSHAQKVMSIPSGDISFPHVWKGIAAALAVIAFTLTANWSRDTPFKLSGLAHFALAVSYCLTMFDLRLIENEHQFWRFASSTYIVIISISRIVKGTSFWPSLLFSGLHFLAQSWNEVGENSSHIAQTLQSFLESHTGILWLLVGVTYLLIGSQPRVSIDTAEKGSLVGISRLLIFTLSMAALLLKFCLTQAMSPELVSCFPEFLIVAAQNVDLTSASRALFTGLIGALVYELLRPGRGDVRKQASLVNITELTALYLLTQSRANNIPLFLVFRLQLEILLSSSNKLSSAQTHALVLLLSQNAYSAFGFTRNISAIDIPNGFNGVAAWSSSPLVPAQICVTLYAGTIWWLLSGLRLIRDSEKLQKDGQTELKVDNRERKNLNGSMKPPVNKHPSPLEQGGFSSNLAYLTVFQAVGLFRLMGASLLNWDNPALWTVVAPASLMVVIDIFIHVSVSCLLAGVSWWRT